MLVYKTIPKRPSIRVEHEFSRQWGDAIVAGIDEAGRGCLAGPVVAGAVILPFEGKRPLGLNDSKLLPREKRERLYRQITRRALAWSVGMATAQEIDLVNILEATRLAVRRALDALPIKPGALVTDALEIPGCALPALPLVKGDQISSSVSAASILAKVTRDRLMGLYHHEFPEFAWHTNMGYGTEEHWTALHAHGPTILHRMTYEGVGFFQVPRRSPTFLRLSEEIALLGENDRERRLSYTQQLQKFSQQLPPPDYSELKRLLAEDFSSKEGTP